MMIRSAPRPVSTPPTEVASRAALRGRVELRHRCALRRHARREELPGTSRSQRYGGNARQFVGEVLSPRL